MSWSRMSALAVDKEHCRSTHYRWVETHLTKRYRESDWIPDQCGGCQFYVCLEASLGSDWGACTNPASPYDGRVMFEHDGCEHHATERDVITPELLTFAEREISNAADHLQTLKEESAETPDH